MKLELGHIELFVKDPLASLTFYQDGLGAELVVNQQDTFIWIKIGTQEILLRPGHPHQAAQSYGQSRAGIVLYTDDMETAVYQLSGYGIQCNPMPNEPECFTFQDPDGNWFQLVDPSSHT